MLLVAVVPALVAGALLSGFVTRVLYDTAAVSGVTFVLGGIAILVIERLRPKATVVDIDRDPDGKAFGSGCAQALAIVPGVSRSGATIMGGLCWASSPGGDRASRSFSRSRHSGGVREQFVEASGMTSERAGIEIADRLRMAFLSSASVVGRF